MRSQSARSYQYQTHLVNAPQVNIGHISISFSSGDARYESILTSEDDLSLIAYAISSIDSSGFFKLSFRWEHVMEDEEFPYINLKPSKRLKLHLVTSTGDRSMTLRVKRNTLEAGKHYIFKCTVTDTSEGSGLSVPFFTWSLSHSTCRFFLERLLDTQLL